MGTFKEHCDDCLKKLGGEFSEVHKYMDQWMSKFGGHHRFMLHHEGGIEEIREKFGDEAAEAARVHIELDCGGNVPKNKRDYNDKKVDWLGYKDSDYKVVDKRTGIVVPKHFKD